MIGDSLEHDKSNELARRLIDFVQDAEEQLHAGERLPLSTEILESAFGRYKQLERQHSKSGFTSLLACLPALLKPTTAKGVREAFERVSAKDVILHAAKSAWNLKGYAPRPKPDILSHAKYHAWVQKHFSSTLTSRRNATHAEHKATLKIATA